jgi:hypothetical protein
LDRFRFIKLALVRAELMPSVGRWCADAFVDVGDVHGSCKKHVRKRVKEVRGTFALVFGVPEVVQPRRIQVWRCGHDWK